MVNYYILSSLMFFLMYALIVVFVPMLPDSSGIYYPTIVTSGELDTNSNWNIVESFESDGVFYIRYNRVRNNCLEVRDYQLVGDKSFPVGN